MGQLLCCMFSQTATLLFLLDIQELTMKLGGGGGGEGEGTRHRGTQDTQHQNRKMKQLEFINSQEPSDENKRKSWRRGRESSKKANADLEEIIS